MARITISLPDSVHQQVLKMAGKENESISYTTVKLIELGLLVMNNKDKNIKEKENSELADYCHKLVIQMNEIIKELAIDNYSFSKEKISQITSDTLIKFNQLKGITQEPL